MRFAGAGLAGVIMEGNGSNIMALCRGLYYYNACSTEPAACTFRSETRATWENGHISNKIWRSTYKYTYIQKNLSRIQDPWMNYGIL